MKTNIQFRIEQLSPYCMIRMLLRNCWMVIAAGICLALAASLLMTWTYKPQYNATMTYAVNSGSESYSSSGSLTAAKEVASVLSELLTTEMIYEGIRGTDPRLASFDGTITATQIPETNFIVVAATADSPERAFLSLSALLDVFPEVASFINSRGGLSIMRYPSVSSYPINPNNTQKMTMLGGIAGAALMVALLCFMTIQRGTVQTRTGARQMLDAPILAAIPHEWKNRTVKTLLRRTNKHVQVFSPTVGFSYMEQINTICAQMEHEASKRSRRVYMITGVGESEGKSTVAGNVAANLAMKGHKVALLDCDLRKPAQNEFFDQEYQGQMPLNKLLSQPFSQENLGKCMVRSEKTGLYMLFALKTDVRSSELLSSQTMLELLDALKDFDFLILDTPPMGMFPDAEILADQADASMLVVRQDYVPACDVNENVDTLKKYKAAFLGVILNDMMVSPHGSYGYGKYGYGSKYGYGQSKSKEHHHSHSDSKHGEGGANNGR